MLVKGIEMILVNQRNEVILVNQRNEVILTVTRFTQDDYKSFAEIFQTNEIPSRHEIPY